MASAFPEINPIDIRDILKCAWCRGQKNSILRRLDCLHFGCEYCLQIQLAGATVGEKFHCPDCNVEITVSYKGVDWFAEEHLQFKIEKIFELFSNQYPPCKVCKLMNNKVSAPKVCIDCSSSYTLCLKHAQDHYASHNHRIKNFESMQSNEVIIAEMTSLVDKCGTHSFRNTEQYLKFYCRQCQKLVCSDCIGVSHYDYDHDIVDVRVLGGKLRNELGKTTEEVKTSLLTAQENVSKLENTLQEITDTAQTMKENFKKWGETMIKEVKKAVDENTMKIEQQTMKDKNEIKELLQQEQKNIKHISCSETYKEVLQKYASDCEIIEDYKHLNQNLKKSLKVKETGDIFQGQYFVEHASTREMQHSIQELFGKLQIQELEYCTVVTRWQTGYNTGVAAEEGVVCIIGLHNIEFYGWNGQRKTRFDCESVCSPCDVELFNGDIYVTDIEKRKVLIMEQNGTVNKAISIFAENSGYKLGIGIDKSNGDIYVSSASEDTVYKCLQDGHTALPHITQNLIGPHHLCVTSNHEVVVANTNAHTVSKFSEKGCLLWEYGGQGAREGQLEEPSGLCVDHMDNIFIADKRNCRIHYVSSYGRFLCFVNIEDTLDKPHAIAMYNKHLFVAHRDKIITVIKCNYK